MSRLFEGTQWDVPPRCERCEELESDCKCPPAPAAPHIVEPSQQRLKILVERRKRGKTVTVIRGVADDDARSSLLTALKNVCGSGGTIRDADLEIQGDHRETLERLLRERGYRI